MDEGLILLVGSGLRRYREYLLASAAARRPVWLLDAADPTWQQPYVAGSTVVELLDRTRLVPDQDGLVKAAAAVAADHRVAGVFSYDETLVVATAHIAEALAVPGLTVEGVENCRNKHRTRRVLSAAGLVQPRCSYVTDAAAALRAADAYGYPVVLKPRGMGASIGVVRADDAAAVAAAFGVAERASHGGSPSYEGGVLVEEYLDGPEISVDGAVVDGGYEPMFVARKRVGLEPYFEEIGHVVDAGDPLLRDGELGRVLTAAHRALGVGYGITHTEVKLTSRGYAIVEVNARLGGDLIPYLGKLASGIDPAHVAVDVAAGERPDLTPTRQRCVGIRFCYPPQDGRVRSVELPDPSTVDGLLEAEAMVVPGTVMNLPPKAYIARYAYLIATGDDRAGCDAVLDEAARRTSVALDPA
jgi:biotin carboxylase